MNRRNLYALVLEHGWSADDVQQMADLLKLPPPDERTPEHRALLAARIKEDPHIARVRLHWERIYRERTGYGWPGTHQHQQETAT